MIGLVILLVAVASACVAVGGYLGLAAKLPPNRWTGVRTAAALRDDDAWHRAQRPAGAILLLGGAAAAAVCLAFLPFAFAGVVGTNAGALVAGIGGAVLFVSAVAAWLLGTRSARHANSGAEQVP